MPQGEPVDLTIAIVFAVIGGLLGLWMVVRLVREHRRKRALVERMPDWSDYDGDVKRYLRRVWLLQETWSTELEHRDAVETTMRQIYEMADELQAARADGQDVSGMVQEMVRLESQLEAEIEAARSVTEDAAE